MRNKNNANKAVWLIVPTIWIIFIALGAIGFLGGCTQRGGKTGVGDIYIWTPIGELLPQTGGPKPDLSSVPGPDNTVHVTDRVIKPSKLR